MAQSSAATDLDRRPSLTITRRLRASPQKVYAAWTKPENLIQWFAAAQAKPGSIGADLDARVGGRYRISFTDEKSGEYHEAGGVYREVVPDQRLKFTWAWHSTPERESLVTVELKGDALGTLMIFTHAQFADQAACDNHERGWSKFFDTLEQVVA
ncbi:MAG: SRPBCC domain-containing protein [Bradyrhizobium sp.]